MRIQTEKKSSIKKINSRPRVVVGNEPLLLVDFQSLDKPILYLSFFVFFLFPSLGGVSKSECTGTPVCGSFFRQIRNDRYSLYSLSTCVYLHPSTSLQFYVLREVKRKGVIKTLYTIVCYTYSIAPWDFAAHLSISNCCVALQANRKEPPRSDAPVPSSSSPSSTSSSSSSSSSSSASSSP